MEKVLDFLIALGWRVLTTFLILVFGFFLVGKILDILERVFHRRKLDATATKFLLHISNFILKLLVIVIAIAQLGVNTLSISAAIGGLAVAIGLALQGSLTNFAGGILILVFKPYKIGEYIKTGDYEGTVEDIQILSTVIKSVDNLQVIVPHSVALSGPVVNYGTEPLRVAVNFFVSLNSHPEEVKRILLGTLEEGDYLQSREPSCILLEETKDALKFSLRFWVANEHYWTLSAKYREKGRHALVEQGIEVPVVQLQTKNG